MLQVRKGCCVDATTAGNPLSGQGNSSLFALPKRPALAGWNRRIWPSDRVGGRGGAMASRAFTRALVLAGTSLGAIGLATDAQAGGFFLHEQSTYFQGT